MADRIPGPSGDSKKAIRTDSRADVYQMPAANADYVPGLPPGFPGDQAAANGPGDSGTAPVTYHERAADPRSKPKNSSKPLFR